MLTVYMHIYICAEQLQTHTQSHSECWHLDLGADCIFDGRLGDWPQRIGSYCKTEWLSIFRKSLNIIKIITFCSILKKSSTYNQSMSVSKNRGKTPQIINFYRVFHYFHHPFWGFCLLHLELPPSLTPTRFTRDAAQQLAGGVAGVSKVTPCVISN